MMSQIIAQLLEWSDDDDDEDDDEDWLNIKIAASALYL